MSNEDLKDCQRLQELIQLATLEMKGSIGYDRIRKEIREILETKQEIVVDFVNSNGDNALQLACENPSTSDIAAEIVRTIGFGNKSVVNNQNKNTGMTALHTVCVRGSVDLIGLLLQYGADIDIKDKNGDTALITACKWVQDGCMLELIRHGANIDTQCAKGTSARMILVKRLDSADVANKIKLKARIEDAMECARSGHLSQRTWSSSI